MFPSFTKVYHNRVYPSISLDRPDISASGKVILITGAGSGIGQATALTFAQAGAKAVIVCGRRILALQETETKITGSGYTTKVLSHVVDVCDENSVAALFKNVTQALGDVDIVINCAGHLAESGSVKSISAEQFWTSFEVNIKGSFNIAKGFLHHCPPSAARPKVLILVSSANAVLPASVVTQSSFSPASYPISKLAEAKLAEYIAAENPTHFRAYALQPGIVETEMATKSMEMTGNPDAARKLLTWDEPQLPAAFMLWLSSRKGHCVPSGRFLFANWDVDELEARSEELGENESLLTMGCVGWPFQA